MPFVRQVSFLGGELSPWMRGRTDSPLHARGLKTAENFLITHEGVAVSRPGTTMVRAVKDAARLPRLVPYVYSETEAWVVELGDGYARFHRDGETEMDGGVPKEISTGYSVEAAAELQWAQVGRKLVLTSRFGAPRVLERSSAGAWTLTLAQSSWMAFIGQACAGELFAGEATTEPALSSAYFTAPDAAHPLVEWRWRVTNTVRQVSTGQLFESAPVEVTQYWDGANLQNLPADNKVVLYPDSPVTLFRSTSGATTYGADYEVVALNYYRGRGGLFGFVGTSSKLEFVDVGATPDYAQQPPQQNNVFPYFGSNENPRAVAHFEDRRAYTGAGPYATRILLSATGNFDDFDRYPKFFSGMPLEYGLAAQRYEEPLSLVASRRLVILTGASVWSLGGGNGDPLDFDTVAARQEDAVGSSGLQPLVVDDSILFVRAKGRGVRALVPTDFGTLRGVDISSHAEHLFRPGSGFVYSSASNPDFRIVDWTYAEQPFRQVWAVRDDGVLLSLAYARDGHAAWARHTFAGVPGGPVTAVCSIPEGDEDGVYLVVRRSFGTFIERMSRRVVTDDPNTFGGVDCAVRVEQDVTSTTIGGLSHLEGQDVYVVGKSNTSVGPLRVSGGAVTLPAKPTANLDSYWAVLFVGLKFTATLELLPLVSTDVVAKQKTVVAVTFEADVGKGVKVGQDVGHLVAPSRREVADSYGAFGLRSVKLRTAISGTWDADAHGVLQQAEPTPVIVLGITREVDIGG